ncbi:hypothetical protein ACHQM5_002900 [Ranunculus cassubicifolius]
MIQLLFTVIAAQVGIILTLLFKTPLRKLVIITLDRLKRGRGPIVVKTIGATVFMVFMSTVFSITKIQKRSVDAGVLNPTDQLLFSKHLLEASLMGFTLILSLMIDRLHHYIRELRMLRKNMEAVKKQHRAAEEARNANSEVKNMEEEITGLKAKVKNLESDCATKAKALQGAEANSLALRKQSEGFLLEYDRLLEENQNLRNQLKSIDQMLSHSVSKKSM